ncbi:tetratricopeptide repeat protein [Methylocapsa sp. S129]|uniref:tetratricopeptide repeat protein n=1 Tax=Methylocapsa sp. S129 TaxID=1641869 RepID=UPI00131CF2BF|nr:tetratricopeptide repeat protein [Methylocapsa sp. S129]
MDTPAQNATVFGHDNIIVQANGSGVNVAVQADKAYLRLTQYEKRTKLAARDKSETGLLSAYRADVVPLVGRDDALDDLRHWLDGEAPVSMRVLVGAGGRGKTRLALELARGISEAGWLAGFATVEELDRFRAQHNVAQWRWDRPVLILIDYAASRAGQIRDWAREISDAALEDGRPRLRLLLIERQANRAIGWLATIFGYGSDDASRALIALLDPPEPVELTAIDDLAFRRRIFAALLGSGGSGLEAPAPGADAEFDRLLADRKWAGDPLYLGMAGLVARREGVSAALSLSRTDLALAIAERELKRIGDIGAAHGVDASGQNHRGAFIRHMAVIATLTQGLTREEARKLAEGEHAALKSAAPLNSSLEAVCDALPVADGSGGVAPILPDIVGEGAILAWLGDKGPIAQWGLPPAARIAAAAQSMLPRVSAVLVRIAQDFAPAGRDEPVRWLESLAETSNADIGALMQIADALPIKTLALRELAVRLTRRITAALRTAVAARKARNSAADRKALLPLSDLLAKSLNNFGDRLSGLGRREDALAATREAVDLYRRLVAESSEAFAPHLANALNNLGSRLGDLGRRKDALAAAREAVDIRRRLAAERPGAFMPLLASALSNYGNKLSEFGRLEDALAPTLEALEIRRRLAAERPDAFMPDLAISLTNLGNRLRELERREEALAPAQEAVDIYRSFAVEQPDAFLPDFAAALINLGVILGKLDRREGALAATTEALDICRRLAAERPEAFMPTLATSLNNLSDKLGKVGRREEARSAAQEAVDIHRRLVAETPDAFMPDFAGSLSDLGKRLRELGRREDALAATQEAVDIHRRVAADGPDAFLPYLATALNDLGGCLSALDRREDAVAAAQEAIDIYRGLAAEISAFLPDLAGSLSNLSDGLSNLGLRDEALGAAQEAVDIYRGLAAERPDGFQPDLAIALNNLGGMFCGLEQRDEALAAAREAVATLAPFFLRAPTAYSQRIFPLCQNYLNRCADAGVEPDHALLGPIVETLQTLPEYQTANASTAD